MREFKSVQDFIKQLSKDVQKSMRTDVINDVADLAIEQAQQEVYDVYTPRVYKRRYSLINRGLWTYVDLSGYLEGYTLELVNLTTPNPYLNGVNGILATTDKHLPTLIEMGHEAYTTKYGGHGYDEPYSSKRYYHPRPFASTTSNILSGNGDRSFKYSLEKSLNTKGYRFEK